MSSCLVMAVLPEPRWQWWSPTCLSRWSRSRYPPRDVCGRMFWFCTQDGESKHAVSELIQKSQMSSNSLNTEINMERFTCQSILVQIWLLSYRCGAYIYIQLIKWTRALHNLLAVYYPKKNAKTFSLYCCLKCFQDT